jgi:hypothetical protein
VIVDRSASAATREKYHKNRFGSQFPEELGLFLGKLRPKILVWEEL